MTVQEQQQIERAIGKRLEDKLTVLQMNQVIAAFRDAAAEVEQQKATFDPEKDNLLEIFLQAKLTEGKSAKTIKHYRYLINRMLEKTQTPIRSITVYQLRDFLSGEMERGISDNTIRNYQDTFSSLFGWLWREELIPKNPAANIKTVKKPKLQKVPFSSAEIELIKENCDTVRDKAIVCFLLSTGCRIEEAIRVNMCDIDMKSMELKVFGKGKKERTVFIDDITAVMLSRYFNTRTEGNEALFIGRSKERITPSGVRAMLKRIEKRSGVQNIHPHRFRRTLATTLASKGMSIQEIAVILGHEEISTTMKYVSVQETSVKHHYQTIVA